ncbi:hypothetical protein [Acinetobacter cumulans]|uniref:hypothetical protein n=1 Tax=Acinetobacter cumulans TaxID=2136182 RepID=UPI00207769A3|nr:hypothetical protein [Acinetobacter cumulans]
MANIQGQKKWSEVRLLETHELARGGLNGNMNEQAKALADRTEFLNQEKASKSEIVQGVFEFGTYAEFDANKATLPANCTVVIGEENNTGTGTWAIGNNSWNGTTLKKSAYDPYEKSKIAINKKVGYDDGVVAQKKINPSIETIAGIELLGFDQKGRLVAVVSQHILNQINKYFDLSKLRQDINDSTAKTSLLKINSSALFPAIYSNNGDIELLGFDDKGHAYFQPSKTLMNKFKASLDLQSYFNNFDYTSIGLLPNKNIVMWGDSMTQNGTSSALAALMTDRSVIGRGIGGQNSKQIAIRAGAIPITVTLAGNTIPASGGVAVTDSNAFGILTQGGSHYGTVIVKIAGVRGTITTNSSGAWTFTRSTAGEAVTTVENEIAVIDGDTAFVPNPEQYRNHTVIIWAGRNWSWGGRAEIVQVRDEILAIVKHLTSKNKRYLVISPCNANGEGIGTERYQLMNDLNAELKLTFGDRYVNIRDSIVKHSLVDLGITPTAQDSIDIANDVPPSSIRSDGVHFTLQGYVYTAQLLQRQILARGW